MTKITTVKELHEQCAKLIADGFGDKDVLISDDDEGNGFHSLYFGFQTDFSVIKQYEACFHGKNNPNDVVLLG